MATIDELAGLLLKKMTGIQSALQALDSEWLGWERHFTFQSDDNELLEPVIAELIFFLEHPKCRINDSILVLNKLCGEKNLGRGWTFSSRAIGEELVALDESTLNALIGLLDILEGDKRMSYARFVTSTACARETLRELAAERFGPGSG